MIVYAYANEGYNYFEKIDDAKRNAAQYMPEGEAVEILKLDIGPVTKSLVMSVLREEGFVQKMTTVCTVKGTR